MAVDEDRKETVLNQNCLIQGTFANYSLKTTRKSSTRVTSLVLASVGRSYAKPSIVASKNQRGWEI